MPDATQSVDWQVAHERLRRGEAAVGKSFSAGPRDLEEIYRKRAAQLARPAAAASVSAGAEAVLVFVVGIERYAVELQRVREVLRDPRITLLPGSPPQLAGVLNVRGRIEPIWETSLLLGLRPSAGSGSGYALLLRRGEFRGALRVDQLVETRTLRPEECQRTAPSSAYAKGVTADMVTWIDPEALLQQGGFG